MGIKSKWVAFQFDQAVGICGRMIDGELNKTDKKGRHTGRNIRQIMKYGIEGEIPEHVDLLIALLGEG